jgi:hypothetical protein
MQRLIREKQVRDTSFRYYQVREKKWHELSKLKLLLKNRESIKKKQK